MGNVKETYSKLFINSNLFTISIYVWQGLAPIGDISLSEHQQLRLGDSRDCPNWLEDRSRDFAVDTH